MKQFSDLYEKSKENNNSYVIQTLGCRTNSYESKVYESQLKQLGWLKHTKNNIKKQIWLSLTRVPSLIQQIAQATEQ